MFEKIIKKLKIASRKAQAQHDVNAFEESEKKNLKKEGT